MSEETKTYNSIFTKMSELFSAYNNFIVSVEQPEGLATLDSSGHLKSDQRPMTVVRQTETTATINPDVLNLWGEVTELNISLAAVDSDSAAEFCIEFISGETATTLSLPASVKFYDNITIQSNMRYQISIINNIALIVGVKK